MRCLYCGNELALLKKLTGYGEFCSEAHRQKYQEQYNRLALTRLLQAQDPQTDRRPLQVGRSGTRSRELHAGAERRQLEAPTAPPKRPPQFEQPDLSGFLPHQFEPALSPSELFSTEPFLAPVTAFLPGSDVRPVAGIAEPVTMGGGDTAIQPPRPVSSGDAGVPSSSGGPKQLNGPHLLDGDHEVALSLFRIDSAPIRDDSAIDYSFGTEFTATMTGLLCLLSEMEAPASDRPLAPVNGNGHSRQWADTNLAFEEIQPAVPEIENVETPADAAAGTMADATTEAVKELAPNGAASGGHVRGVPLLLGAAGSGRDAVEEPASNGMEEAGAEADTALFEAPPASESAAVVVNLAALGGPQWVPERAHKAGVVSVVVSDDEEIRKLLGLYVEEQPEASPAAEAAPPLQQEVIAVPAAPVALEDHPAEPADLQPDWEAPTAAAAPPEVAEEVSPEEAWPDEEQAIPVLAGEGIPAADGETAEAPAAEEAIEPPGREIIPAVCNEFVPVHLDLADDAFTPISEAEFAGPDFQITAPTVSAAPLRPKVVFGPTPVPEEALAGEFAGIAEGEVAQTQPDLSPAETAPVLPSGDEPATPRLAAEEAEAPESRPRQGRRFDDLTPPAEVPGGIPGAAQAAARLRSLSSRGKTPGPPAAPAEEAPAVPAAGPAPPIPAREPEPEAKPPEKPPADLESLRLEMERLGAPVLTPSVRSRRIAVAIALVLAVILVGYLLREAFAAKPETRVPQSRLETFGPSLVSGEQGWSLDWAGSKATAFPGRRIYIFRPSLSMSDYRIEFKGQIETRGLGWIFRAANPRNYYAIKLEMVKAGLNPKVVLSRTAVINGEETQKSESELPMPVSLDTVYEVRTDVWASTFKTYIQDQLVDTWIDDRLKIGGFGLLCDKDEVAQVRLIQLYGLRLVTP